MLDPVKDMNIRDKQFVKQWKQIAALKARIAEMPFNTAVDKDERYDAYKYRLSLEADIKKIQQKIQVRVSYSHHTLKYCDYV
jgi:superfamily II RNA helicase